MKLIRYNVIIIILILNYSCVKQCETLESRIKDCKEKILSCEKNSKYYSQACRDVNDAYELVQKINQSSKRESFEDSCSLTLNQINFNDCKHIEDVEFKNFKEEDDNINYIMNGFGKKSSINTYNSKFKVTTEFSSNKEDACYDIIKDKYNKKSNEMDLDFRILYGRTIESMTTLLTKDNIFIGYKYSACNFNEEFKFNSSSRAFDNICKIDFTFCSSSSGWLETDDLESNCSLKKEEVFLLNWKENSFMDWCTRNYRLNPFDGSSCSDGCSYKCIKESFIQCKKLYLDNSCALIGNVITDECFDKFTKNDKDVLNKCFKDIYTPICKKNCIDEEGECDIVSCMKDNIKMDYYRNNESTILECLSNEIFNLSDDFLNCSINNQGECNLDTRLNNCVEDNCKDICDINDEKSMKQCKFYSCYTDCEERVYKLEIDKEKSSIFTFFKEMDGGYSKCSVDEIFKNSKYCVVDLDIKEE